MYHVYIYMWKNCTCAFCPQVSEHSGILCQCSMVTGCLLLWLPQAQLEELPGRQTEEHDPERRTEVGTAGPSFDKKQNVWGLTDWSEDGWSWCFGTRGQLGDECVCFFFGGGGRGSQAACVRGSEVLGSLRLLSVGRKTDNSAVVWGWCFGTSW